MRKGEEGGLLTNLICLRRRRCAKVLVFSVVKRKEDLVNINLHTAWLFVGFFFSRGTGLVSQSEGGSPSGDSFQGPG